MKFKFILAIVSFFLFIEGCAYRGPAYYAEKRQIKAINDGETVSRPLYGENNELIGNMYFSLKTGMYFTPLPGYRPITEYEKYHIARIISQKSLSGVIPPRHGHKTDTKM
jgi:hypothetical protein